MTVRLGFAMATAVRPQILILDEWLLAGDVGFIEKARRRLESIVRGVDILVMSSHSTAIIQQWSNRVIWLDRGHIVADGAADEVLRSYLPPDEWQRIAAADGKGARQPASA
jgi:lipopolysaccharide transport system ATP-binding protein